MFGISKMNFNIIEIIRARFFVLSSNPPLAWTKEASFTESVAVRVEPPEPKEVISEALMSLEQPDNGQFDNLDY